MCVPQTLRANRDEKKVEATLRALTDAASSGDSSNGPNLLALAIAAAKAKCTVCSLSASKRTHRMSRLPPQLHDVQAAGLHWWSVARLRWARFQMRLSVSGEGAPTPRTQACA